MKTSAVFGVLRYLTVASAFLAASAACTPQTVVASSAPAMSAPVRGITVSGFGKVNGKPDVARTTIGVEARAGTAEEAIADVNSRMARVIAAVKQAGVADADVRTATLSLNFERSYEPQPPQPPPVPAVAPAAPGKIKSADARPEAVVAPPPKLPEGFYTAQNNIELTMRNLDAAGKVVSAATSAGANQLFGIRFEIEEPSGLLAEARKMAVADARRRAEALAQLAGVKLGPAISIVELDAGAPGPMPAFAAMQRHEAAPIERGELTVTSSVQIVYSLPE
jgi:uncharacterized protein YggE